MIETISGFPDNVVAFRAGLTSHARTTRRL
jgi:hypothetical protein